MFNSGLTLWTDYCSDQGEVNKCKFIVCAVVTVKYRAHMQRPTSHKA